MKTDYKSKLVEFNQEKFSYLQKYFASMENYLYEVVIRKTKTLHRNTSEFAT